MPQIYILDKLSKTQLKDWVALHHKCFKRGRAYAYNCYVKYRLNKPKFCMVYENDALVACYSGIFVRSNIATIFLSTDTMSDGTIRGGSIIAAENLYSHLIQVGVDLVCGYPNATIVGLREKKLGWKFVTNLELFLMPIFILPVNLNPLIRLNRPKYGFFRSSSGLVALGNFDKHKWSLVRLELSNVRPTWFSLNLSRFFGFGRKSLYYRVLNEKLDADLLNQFMTATYTSASIDVP